MKVKVQKIDDFSLKTYKIVMAKFQVINKLENARFFQKTFLLTHININIIINNFFLIINNANIIFINSKLI